MNPSKSSPRWVIPAGLTLLAVLAVVTVLGDTLWSWIAPPPVAISGAPASSVPPVQSAPSTPQ